MSALERYQPPQRLDEIERLASHFASSGLFGNSPKTQGEIIVKMLAGAENGFPPFASVQGIHVIQGKPEMGADLLARSVKQSGRYDYRVRELTDEACRIEFFEHGESVGISEFSLADAKRAGISNAMYGKYPRNMLFARAMSNGVSWYCPDATSTRFYVDGEISNQPAPSETVIHDVTVEPEPVRVPEQPVEPPPPGAHVAGEPERIVADQLAAIGAEGRKRIKAYLSDHDLVLDGDRRAADTWIRSIMAHWNWCDSDDEPPMYTRLDFVLAEIDRAFPSSTPLTRLGEEDAKLDKETEGLFDEHAPKAQGALTPRMYDANTAGS